MTKIDYLKVDWSKSSQEIAIFHGVALNTINTARRKYAPETINKKYRKVQRNYIEADWTMDPKKLARIFKVTLKTIITYRQMYCPQKKKTGRLPKCDWSKVDWSMSNKELAEKIKCNKSYVSTQRKILAPQTAQHYKRMKKTRKKHNLNS